MDILKTLFLGDNVYANIFRVVLSLVSAYLIHFILFSALKRASRYWDFFHYDTITKKLKRPSLWLLLTIVSNITLPLLSLNAQTYGVIHHSLSILITIMVAWTLIQAVEVVRVIGLEHYDLNAPNNLEARKAHTQFKIIERIVDFLIIIVAIGVILMTFEQIRQIGVSLLASAGIAGIILGFAAQKLIATIIAGIQLALTQPIRLDDVVIVEKEWGRIEEITLTYVVVRIWDKRRLIVPTTYFIDKPFQNWTRVSSDLIGAIFLYMDYSVPFDALRAELEHILQGNPLWDEEVANVQVTDAKENTVEVRILVGAKNSSDAWDLRVFVREKLIHFLQQNYPQALPRVRLAMKAQELNLPSN